MSKFASASLSVALRKERDFFNSEAYSTAREDAWIIYLSSSTAAAAAAAAAAAPDDIAFDRDGGAGPNESSKLEATEGCNRLTDSNFSMRLIRV